MKPDPWDLTKRQRAALSLYAACGCRKVVCDRLEIGEAALSYLIRRACERMGAFTDMQAVLMWDRWERDGIGRAEVPPMSAHDRRHANDVLLRNLMKVRGML
jgi:hypothetical protein